MPKGVNYPLYIPPSCVEVLQLIAANRSSDAISVIERKAARGDNAAAALLGYLQLRGALSDADLDVVRGGLTKAAEEGEPFGEFVMALALLGKKEPASAHWMGRSANHLFPPAMAHLGRFMVLGVGFITPSRESAWTMYKLALKHGHVPSTTFAADLLRTSAHPLVRFAGRLLYTLASLFTAIYFLARPFGQSSFIHISAEWPLFSKTGRHDW
jgi:TPR repeat protein